MMKLFATISLLGLLAIPAQAGNVTDIGNGWGIEHTGKVCFARKKYPKNDGLLTFFRKSNNMLFMEYRDSDTFMYNSEDSKEDGFKMIAIIVFKFKDESKPDLAVFEDKLFDSEKVRWTLSYSGSVVDDEGQEEPGMKMTFPEKLKAAKELAVYYGFDSYIEAQVHVDLSRIDKILDYFDRNCPSKE